MNMFKPTSAKNIDEYIRTLSPERQELITFLHDFIQKTVPNLRAHFASNMLGYGSFPYKNYKKETIEWPVISLASQKQYVSIYVCAIHDGQYIAEKYKDQLGKVSVGRSCIRFRKIEDINVSVLKKVLEEAEKNPGLVQS